MHEAGMNYSNLRAENILVKFSSDGLRIDRIKLINFGYVIMLNQHDQVIVPEQVDHYPTDYLHTLIEAVMSRTPSQESSQGSTGNQDQTASISEIRTPLTSPFDVHSLGILLLEIISGSKKPV